MTVATSCRACGAENIVVEGVCARCGHNEGTFAPAKRRPPASAPRTRPSRRSSPDCAPGRHVFVGSRVKYVGGSQRAIFQRCSIRACRATNYVPVD